MVVIINVLLVDFCTQLALVFAATIADEGMSSHDAPRRSDGFMFCIYTLKVNDMLQRLKSDNQYSNNVHTVEC